MVNIIKRILIAIFGIFDGLSEESKSEILRTIVKSFEIFLRAYYRQHSRQD